MEASSFLQLEANDNVVVALKDLKKGTKITVKQNDVVVAEDIPAKHKLFLQDMHPGSEIIMYGVLVGKTQSEVPKGGLMSTANTKHAADPFSYRDYKYSWQPPDVTKFKNRTFNGYHRKDGRVGTANYWLFIPTVFCENRNLDVLKEVLHNELGYSDTEKYKQFTRSLVKAYSEGQNLDQFDTGQLAPQQNHQRLFENVDGIKFLNHEGGCGGTRQDSAILSSLLVSYADHPNVAGVTLLSLGCQHLQIPDFKNDIQKRNPSFDKPLLIFEQQAMESEETLVKKAIVQTFKHLVEINKLHREPAPLSKLSVGVKCGGSDGFSGISANPAVGYTSDLLVGLGAKVLLAEFPELCGAEQDLIDRSVSQDVAEKFIHLMRAYNQLAELTGSGFFANPSPGNIKDGLITDAIKSAGAVRKGGRSPVVDVVDYTEPANKPGLTLVCTPGNDVEATTGKAASGATLILFTTGLGTPTGNPVCPVIKISTNTSLARRMKDVIDIDAGTIISGEKTVEQVGEEILEYCIKVASGEEIPKTVQLNQDDFIPWKRGVSL
jgi:altronate hydrolase